ncbi:MAG: 23S rRNA (pseudouridine(1915)-N(3))-methyltransferase RlmH [Pseudomonadota bacterium]
MRVALVAVGRAKPGPVRELYDFYAARLSWPVSLREVEERRHLDRQSLKEREGELILAAIPEGARLVALDERGKLITSEAFAALIGDLRDAGERDLAFAIGGPEGLSRAVLDRAWRTLALGRMTWPHMMVRGLLAEQLYRAQSILAGHPYHRA